MKNYKIKHGTLVSVDKDITEFTIPDSVKRIGSSAFCNCIRLTEINIPNSVSSIESWVFYNCISLKTINIPNSVHTIGKYCFDGCISIETITIPDSIESIDDYTFYNCLSLKNVNIPDSVTQVSERAFIGCSKLTEFSKMVINYSSIIDSKVWYRELYSRDESLKETTISNIDNEYIIITDLPNDKFFKNSLEHDSGKHYPKYKLYLSKEKFNEEMDIKRIYSELKTIFTYNMENTLDITKLKRIMGIINS